MRRILLCALLSLAMLTSTGATLAQSQGTPDDEPVEPRGISRDDAIARVLASDPRFADLIDYDTLRRRVASDFSFEEYFTSGYYRVLGPTLSDLADGGWVALRAPVERLIEVNLAAECVEPDWDGLPMPVPDPCAWRHTWVYLVEPDGTMLPIFDTGDPEPMP